MLIDKKTGNGRADFDFLLDDWQIQNRRLRERLKGSTEWEEFKGSASVRPLLGGLGNMDEVTFNRASGIMRGVTLRLFDIAAQQWRIYWTDGSRGQLEVPMVGSFVGGRGEFYAQELFEGKAIFSRLSGRLFLRTPAAGNRRFPPMVARRGKQTG